MVTPPAQKGILVRKADGSFARLPADAVAHRTKPSMPNPTPPQLERLKSDGSPRPVAPRETGAEEFQKPPANVAPQKPIIKKPVPAPPPKPWDDDDHRSLLDPQFHAMPPAAAPRASRALATTAPVKAIFTDMARAEEHKKNRGSVKPEYPWDEGSRRPGAARPVIHDALPPPAKRTSMGPVDELRAMTLMDFRRLAERTPDAAQKLRQKFTVLQDESFLLFLDARRAWHESPLFRSYAGKVRTALKERKTIPTVLAGDGRDDTLTEEEFFALLALERELS